MNEQDATCHRFFRTMVLMGSSLALGCGGVTDPVGKTTSAGGSGGGGTGGSGGGGRGGSSGVSGRGGTGAGGTGIGGSGGSYAGSGGSGGSVIGGTGGESPVDAGPFECHPAQWECTTTQPDCDDGRNGWTLPANCGCNPDRPRSAADCPDGKVLVCLRGAFNSDGRPLREEVPFACSCQPKQDTCREECDAAFPNQRLTCPYEEPDSGRRSVLCGCAVIVLL